MPAITTLTFFSFQKHRLWAFKQMGVVGKQMQEVKGLQFYKFLGTGGGDGFSLSPDFSTYAFMGVWTKQEDYTHFISNHRVFKSYQKKPIPKEILFCNPLKAMENGVDSIRLKILKVHLTSSS